MLLSQDRQASQRIPPHLLPAAAHTPYIGYAISHAVSKRGGAPENLLRIEKRSRYRCVRNNQVRTQYLLLAVQTLYVYTWYINSRYLVLIRIQFGIFGTTCTAVWCTCHGRGMQHACGAIIWKYLRSSDVLYWCARSPNLPSWRFLQ